MRAALWPLCAVAALLLCGAALAQAEPTPADEQVGVFTLVVNEVPRGEVTLVITANDVWLEPADLIRGEGYNHFEFIETMANPYSQLGRAALEQMKLAPS